jgi:hypothetical protein
MNEIFLMAVSMGCRMVYGRDPTWIFCRARSVDKIDRKPFLQISIDRGGNFLLYKMKF